MFSTTATRWGCEHEKDAKKAYIDITAQSHGKVQVQQCGFCVSFERPYIDASPDGIVHCNCCNDKVILEVKCPHCIKDGICEDEDREFCMEKVNGCNWKLKRNHCYYYQVQVQMNICNIANADFVVWTETNIIKERIKIDKEFFDNECIKLNIFLCMGLHLNFLANGTLERM